jgi:hypothetical protein
MCPQCRSERLKIKRMGGSERFVVFFTGQRKYRCQECGLGFRAPDRRAVSREISDGFLAENRVDSRAEVNSH